MTNEHEDSQKGAPQVGYRGPSNESDSFRSGFVAVVGRPNTGKSTLLNALADRKVAIVSDKPQTTRHAIRAVIDQPDTQIVVVDTPGYHKPHHLLGERLNHSVEANLSGVDAILFMVDAESGIGRGDGFVAHNLLDVKVPIILCVNKIDAVGPNRLSEQLASAAELPGDFSEVVALSALKGHNVDYLLEKLAGLMPPGPRYYPEGMYTDQPEKMVVAEIIREKILAHTHEEVPHGVAVEVEEIEHRDDGDMINIEAMIYVERESQKGILIGKGGEMLKLYGTEARKELELILASRIYLGLRVKVRKNWRRDGAFLARIGIN